LARVTLSADLLRYTGQARKVEIEADNYRDLVIELCHRFPELDEETVRKQALAIDGMLIHRPMLERFKRDSELVFVARIAGG